eukprot:5791211-Pyramimonas_sp.AAC.1
MGSGAPGVVFRDAAMCSLRRISGCVRSLCPRAGASLQAPPEKASLSSDPSKIMLTISFTQA